MTREGYSPTGGLHFDDEEFESRLVWIWTSARSGSTWLLRMLSHPLKLVDSSTDPEDRLGFLAPVTWQGKVDAIPVDTTFISNHLLPLYGNADYNEKLMPLTFPAALGLRKRGNYFFSSKYEDAWLPEVRRMMLVRFHRLVERTAERYEVKSPLVLLKEVRGGHGAPLVMSMFPRSKMVLLVRDGRDVVDSQTAANQPGAWLPVTGWETDEERHEFIERKARTWVGDVASIQRALNRHPPELRRTIRYEDLLADPASELGGLVEFLGLRRSERWLERAIQANAFESIAPEQKGPKKFFRSATPGAWRKNITGEDAATLEDVMRDKLRELDYAVADGPVHHGDEDFGDNGPSGGETSAEASPNEVDPDAELNVITPGLGPQVAQRHALSAYIQKAGKGRDFSNLVRLIDKRGSIASRRDRKVALTFDDGPVLQTHRVLDTLERYDARGTFFLVGRKLDGHQETIRRLLSGGHEIGNHSYGHWAFSQPDDIAVCTALLQHVAGARPKLFRPPFGAVDRPMAEAAIEDGMRVILWSANSGDATPPWKGISAEEVISNVFDHVLPGAIVLLHDGIPWSRATDALPQLIEGLKGRGFELVTVSEVLANPPPRPAPLPRRVLRRLGRGIGIAQSPAQPARRPPRPTAPPADGAASNGSPAGGDAERRARERLAELLETVREGVEAPPEETDAGPAGNLIRGTCSGLLGPPATSDLLARHAGPYEINAVRAIALGFSLRRFEGTEGDAAVLPEESKAKLWAAEDPGGEARLVAEKLAAPRKVEVVVAQRLAERAAGESGDPVQPGVNGASPTFLSMFGPGPEIWEPIASWARETAQVVAKRRMQALLDAAGVNGGTDIEALIERLDVDFYFRFGYALAACEEELSRKDS